MANYTLTTTPQEVGRNTTPTVGARMLAWYTNATTSGATVHLKLQAISQGTTYAGTNKDYELQLDTTSTGTVSWSYAPLPQDTWVDVVEITQYVAFGRTVTIVGKVWTYVYGDAWITGNTVTLATPYVAPTTPTISASNISATSNTITYGTTSFGNPATGTVTLYGGTTANPTTVLDTYNATGDHTFTHTGLTPETTYYYRAKANNGQLDSSYSTEVSATTQSAGKLYGSVNGETKRVVKLYGSVNGQTKEITKLYGSVGGVTKRIY